jgi:uncharacterized membrane protein
MQQHFIKGEFVEGIKEAVLACGDALKKHFPIKHDDSNELPNDISYQ